MKQKSQKLAKKIEAMQAELAATLKAESEASDRELMTLIHKAGCRDEVFGFVRHVLALKREERTGTPR